MIRKKTGKIKVHFYDEKEMKIKTRAYGEVFDVVEEKKANRNHVEGKI